MDPKIIVEVMRILVSPKSTDSCVLESVFEANLKNAAELLASSEKYTTIRNHLSTDEELYGDDLRWKFVVHNLQLLHLLQTSLDDSVAHQQDSKSVPPSGAKSMPPLAADALSIQQLKIVSVSLQYIVFLGIYPYFLPGILTRMSEYGSKFEGNASSVHRCQFHSNCRLVTTVKTLLECVDGTLSKTLGELIISKHFGDLLAALCQIHCKVRIEGAAVSCDCNTDCFNKLASMPVVNYATLDFCKEQLNVLLEKTHQPLVIRHLLMLQNGVPPPSNIRSGEAGRLRTPKLIWLKKLTQTLLTQRFIQPFGVHSLLMVLLQGVDDENSPSVDWKIFDNVAKIIVDCPLEGLITVDEYYMKISAQILDLLRTKNKHETGEIQSEHRHQCQRVAVQMISLMILRQPQLTAKFVMNKILSPLLLCLEDPDTDVINLTSKNSRVLIEEDLLTCCIEDIHTLLVSNSDPAEPLVASVLPVLGVLFPLYCYVRQSEAYLRNKIEDILHTIFRHLDLSTALGYLIQLSVETVVDPNDTQIMKMSPHLEFKRVLADKGIKVILQNENLSTTEVRARNLGYNVVHLIVSSQRQDDIGAELFLFCMKHLTDLASQEVDSCDSNRLYFLVSSQEVKLYNQSLAIFSLLEAMLEKIEPACLSKASHILSFAESNLERGVKILAKDDTDVMFAPFETETLSLAMSLLTFILCNKDMVSSLDWTKMQNLLPLLEEVYDLTTEESLKEMAFDLRISIATHGIILKSKVKSTLDESSSSAIKASKLKAEKSIMCDIKMINYDSTGHKDDAASLAMNSCKTSRPLIEIQSSIDFQEEEHKRTNDSNIAEQTVHIELPEGDDPAITTTLPMQKLTNFEQAMEEVCDSMVPVRGHGLIALRKLVERQDVETVANLETILEVSRLNLSHPDSYIYLGAIQLMAALAYKDSKRVLPQLAKEYSSSSKEVKRSPELQMKLGEVLVKVSTGLGEMVPNFKDLLLDAVLNAVKDPEPLVRASAVSNLGQICQLLHFSLGNIIHEVFNCIQNLLKYEASTEVRRSAAMFFSLLFRGLSKDLFTVLNNSVPLECYRLLKHVRDVDKDVIVKQHVLLAIEELDIIIRDFITPPKTLTKRIHVLDPFD